MTRRLGSVALGHPYYARVLAAVEPVPKAALQGQGDCP
jgi:hypothetical protein